MNRYQIVVNIPKNHVVHIYSSNDCSKNIYQEKLAGSSITGSNNTDLDEFPGNDSILSAASHHGRKGVKAKTSFQGPHGVKFKSEYEGCEPPVFVEQVGIPVPVQVPVPVFIESPPVAVGVPVPVGVPVYPAYSAYPNGVGVW